MNEYIVEAKNIYKSFPGVKALDNVSFNLKSGEVLALLGENGAGKSTLMKILSGVYSRDSGEIYFFGKKVGELSPRKAQEIGIAMIHQELNLCPHLSVAENIFLGREITHIGIVSHNEMNKKAKEILDKLNIDISPETIVGDLTVSKQQMVEIAKALSLNAKILIMDEPTSALTSKEIDDLFKIINTLKSEGCGIIYISHRLDELQYVADRITIMRDGKHILTTNFKDVSMNDIIAYMVGREIKEKFPRISSNRGKKILEVVNLNAGRLVRNISFELFEGEIVGIAGLMGSGRTELTRAIFGANTKESGDIYLNGKLIKINRPIDAIKAGIVLVPEDRKKDGLCTKLSVKDNISLPNLDILCKSMGIIDRKKEKNMVNSAVRDLMIKLPNIDVDANKLSGGNQQKVVVSKWMARNFKVVMFDEPTRGIDVAAKVEIYNLMNELKKQGIGVLFVSSEMPEILGMSDRIIVMCDGKITGELDIKDATQKKILEYATKFDNKIAVS
ncbi:sugar ABC transporter ATP-binding protein [Caloramator sp. E03]|uniref:sugar ABC transporter ATP-binding protein n=1 Tax=Caloramator sp. E03 TaxID=2576307 RepID=UPI001110B84B|nr:sugar ABC transporter ATP-binding protein [Caloramator sp. E03]QCX34115.1 sugar ABC transporter ATP-binding protein [Caloramator sp. E03]